MNNLVEPTKCECCGGRLGLQNPNTICEMCVFIRAGNKFVLVDIAPHEYKIVVDS